MASRLLTHISSPSADFSDFLVLRLEYFGEPADAPWLHSWRLQAHEDQLLRLQVDADLLGRGEFRLAEISYTINDQTTLASPPTQYDVLCRIQESDKVCHMTILFRMVGEKEPTAHGEWEAKDNVSLELDAQSQLMGPAEMALHGARIIHAR